MGVSAEGVWEGDFGLAGEGWVWGEEYGCREEGLAESGHAVGGGGGEFGPKSCDSG